MCALNRADLKLVGVVGVGLKATLKTRKLLILLNEKNAKNTGFAQVRYTAGTRNCFAHRQWTKRTCLSNDKTKSLCPVVEGIVLTPLARVIQLEEAVSAR